MHRGCYRGWDWPLHTRTNDFFQTFWQFLNVQLTTRIRFWIQQTQCHRFSNRQFQWLCLFFFVITHQELFQEDYSLSLSIKNSRALNFFHENINGQLSAWVRWGTCILKINSRSHLVPWWGPSLARCPLWWPQAAWRLERSPSHCSVASFGSWCEHRSLNRRLQVPKLIHWLASK